MGIFVIISLLYMVFGRAYSHSNDNYRPDR